MKVNPADWRKLTLAGFSAQRAQLAQQKNAIDEQIHDLDVIINALMATELNSKPTRKTREFKDPKGRAAKSAAWTPERRAKQARLMRKRMKEKKANAKTT